MSQKEIEKLNKQIIEEITKRKDEFLDYYYVHSGKETIEYFNLRNKRQLLILLNLFNYDKERKKKHNVLKGRKSTRSHESYILGGKKSSETQKASWENKTQEEKDAWKQLQIDTHHTQEYRDKMSKIAKDTFNSLSEERKQEMNLSRSKSCKSWWDSLSEDEKNNIVQRNIANGAGWNKETIRKTIRERYNVENISQVEMFNEKKMNSTIKTCQEKYGVNYYVQTPMCYSAMGNHACYSKPNEKFSELLKQYPELNYTSTIGIDREFVIEKFSYDFKIHNTLIEINPTPTHNSTWGMSKRKTALPKYYHEDKWLMAKKHNYKCIHVWDWDDQNKIVNLLLNRETIYARNCKIKDVSKREAKQFLNKYHLQNYARCSILIGLYYNNELVSIMTFGKPRYNKNYDYELIRYCSIKNVIGGAQKLLTNFIRKYNPKTIISYCDKAKFTGDTYLKLGFKLIKDGRPSKHWYNIKTEEHYTDALIRQQGFSRVVHHKDASEENLSTNNNRQLMLEEGFVEIYDCGQSTYLLTI